MSLALNVEHLAVSLGGREVLRDVSFTLAPGGFCGLIGANGAGKTTLLRTILGFERPTAGHIHRAGTLGYVPQKLQLDPDAPLRVRDFLRLGLDGHRWGIPLPSRAARAQVDEIVAAIGADAFADQRVGRLSGGQLQRVLIGHALIRRPQLLLLDEPLANLDPSAAAAVAALLGQVAAGGVAVLLSAHDLNPLLGHVDRVVYLANGRAAAGPVAEVVRGEVLSALYGTHIDVLRVHGRIVVVAGNGAAHDHDHAVPIP